MVGCDLDYHLGKFTWLCNYYVYNLHVLLHSDWLSVFLFEVWKSISDEFRTSGCDWLAAGLAVIPGICQIEQTPTAYGAHLLSHLDVVLMNPAKHWDSNSNHLLNGFGYAQWKIGRGLSLSNTIKYHCLQMSRAAMLKAFTARWLESCAGERRSVKVSEKKNFTWVTAELWLRRRRTRQQNLTKMRVTQNQTVKHWQVGPAAPTISFPANLSPPHPHSLCPAPPLPHPPPDSPPLLKTFFKQKNAVVCSEGCACRLMPTPGFSRRPVLFLALISGCWKFGNRCLKPCKRF